MVFAAELLYTPTMGQPVMLLPGCESLPAKVCIPAGYAASRPPTSMADPPKGARLELGTAEVHVATTPLIPLPPYVEGLQLNEYRISSAHGGGFN